MSRAEGQRAIRQILERNAVESRNSSISHQIRARLQPLTPRKGSKATQTQTPNFCSQALENLEIPQKQNLPKSHAPGPGNSSSNPTRQEQIFGGAGAEGRGERNPELRAILEGGAGEHGSEKAGCDLWRKKPKQRQSLLRIKGSGGGALPRAAAAEIVQETHQRQQHQWKEKTG